MKELKSFFIRTYGCQMNELDSEILATQLEDRNLKLSISEEEADIIIFNTCSIRAVAERKVLGKLLEYKSKEKIIGLAGCMVMRGKEKLLKELSFVDFILGTNNLLDIGNILDEILSSGKQVNRTSIKYEMGLESFFAKRDSKFKASVSIIRGCNNFCSYCIVPFTRGREVSRSLESIHQECIHLAQKGYKEITLLGQNVNSYGNDFKDKKDSFSDLLYKLDKIDGIERIRFMTSHPKDISLDLMYAIRDLKKVCEFVHFPLQSGSNKILKKMNRKYSKEDYLERVFKLKEIVPNIAIGTDIIVGFPGEEEKDFEETYNLFKKIEYDTAFIFAYSPREGTLSAKFKDNVSKKDKLNRLQSLLTFYRTILKEKYKKLIGSSTTVLIEKTSKDKKYLKGRTSRFEKVIIEGPASTIGTVQKVKIIDFKHQTLIAKIINS